VINLLFSGCQIQVALITLLRRRCQLHKSSIYKDRENGTFLTRNRRGSPARVVSQSSWFARSDQSTGPALDWEWTSLRSAGLRVSPPTAGAGDAWVALTRYPGTGLVRVTYAVRIGSFGAVGHGPAAALSERPRAGWDAGLHRTRWAIVRIGAMKANNSRVPYLSNPRARESRRVGAREAFRGHRFALPETRATAVSRMDRSGNAGPRSPRP
jgi:hypothetical protein